MMMVVTRILKGGEEITKIYGASPEIKYVLRVLASTDDEWESSGNDTSKIS